MKKHVLWTISGGLLAAVAFASIVIFSGLYDVSAISKENSILRWAFQTTLRHNVASRAAPIVVPDLRDSTLFRHGFEHYDAMCTSCHGAPGREAEELAAGLNPPPPRLTHAAHVWSPAELFVIVKNGIRMTGMPAFSPTHDDLAIWGMVAFLQRLPTLTPEEYNALSEKIDMPMSGTLSSERGTHEGQEHNHHEHTH